MAKNPEMERRMKGDLIDLSEIESLYGRKYIFA